MWRRMSAMLAIGLMATACQSAPAAAPTTAPAATTAPKPAATSAPPTVAPTAAAKPTVAATTAPAATAAPTTAAAGAPAAAIGAGADLLPKPEQTTIKVGNAAHEVDSFAPEFANQLGIYEKYGFTKVETFYFDGDAKGRQALLAGQIDFLSGGPGSSISSQLTDTPLEAVGTFILHPTDDIVTTKDVRTAQDLKGKQVAVSSFGGDSHASVLLGLKALGLTPDDVTITPIGGERARVAALLGGSVSAAPVDSAIEEEMKAQGLNILLRLPDAPVTLARESLQVRKDFAQKNPNTVLAVAAASMAAEQQLWPQKDKAIDGFLEWAQVKDRDAASIEVNAYLPVANRSMRFAPDGWENLKEVMVYADPNIKDVDVTKAYTFQFLDKLHQLGFDKAVGVPGA